VRLSAAPFSATPPAPPPAAAEPDPVRRAVVAHAVNGVGDALVREALRELGHALATRRPR